jgi:ribosomal protein S18 acetylase RimI-like enzyme/O-methyltransferase involved in polyketide biosynthesis
MVNQSSPVGKTAFDAIQAKYSALSAGYNTSMVVTNQLHYQKLLETIVMDQRMRRQTPLVNAGYAARVLVVSHLLDKFLSHPNKQVQIVLLGCGADVIGLWAHSLTSKIKLLEVDTSEICLAKSDLLTRHKLVVGQPETDGTLVGRVIMDDSSSSSSSSSSSLDNNYILCPVDLRDINKLNSVVQEYLDHTVPTLVLTELVLSYVSPKQTDDLLAYVSSTLCRAQNSCFVALEPLGYSSLECTVGTTQGYRQRYCKMFESKMERGMATKEEESLFFSPIGNSCAHVTQRLLQQGFSSVNVNSLGKAAAAAALKPFTIPEIFDEHAALALHLKSYIIAVSFSSNTEQFLQRSMCPWDYPTEIPPMLTTGDTTIAITVIESMDEEAVQDLVRNIYKPNFEKYPAVRKMITRMMNLDLSISKQEQNSDNAKQQDSTIAKRYHDLGGIFFVALEFKDNERKVIGCVGVRPWGHQKKDALVNLEVVRLAVLAEYRGKGIGTKLLEMVELFAQRTRRDQSKLLVANTISILASAKRLYESCGYTLKKETNLGGNLSMSTYERRLAYD